MPGVNSDRRPSTSLRVEALEAREVPASFGATRGLDVAHGDIISSNVGTEFVTGTGPGPQALVRVWSNDGRGRLLYSFNPFPGFRGGVYVDVANVKLGTPQLPDNTFELIVSTGPGTTGRVKVYSFSFGGLQTLADFTPFGPTYGGGVQIAAGNVTGDRAHEIVVGRERGGSTVQVYAFDEINPQVVKLREFQAYGPNYTGGVTLAAANTDNTRNSGIPGSYDFNFAEIITGTARGSTRVAIFDAQTPDVVRRTSYLAFNARNPFFRSGIDVAAGSTDGVRGAEIYVALKNAGVVRFFSGQTGATIGTVRPFPAAFARTVNMAISSVDDDIFDVYLVGDLIVVGADGPYQQVPLIYPGRFLSPAGLNGSRPAA
jgi:hypothetical protein